MSTKLEGLTAKMTAADQFAGRRVVDRECSRCASGGGSVSLAVSSQRLKWSRVTGHLRVRSET